MLAAIREAMRAERLIYRSLVCATDGAHRRMAEERWQFRHAVRLAKGCAASPSDIFDKARAQPRMWGKAPTDLSRLDCWEA